MATTIDAATLEKKVTQIGTDSDLLHSFVHGGTSDVVLLGGVQTPSLRNLMYTIDRRESAAATTAINNATASAISQCNTYKNNVENAATTAINSFNEAKQQISTAVNNFNTNVNIQLDRIHEAGDTQYNNILAVANEAKDAVYEAKNDLLNTSSGVKTRIITAVEQTGTSCQNRLINTANEQVNVIHSATNSALDSISTELAGKIQTLQAEATTQKQKLVTEGNKQFARIEEEGNTEVQRVINEGEAQVRMVNTQGDAIENRLNVIKRTCEETLQDVISEGSNQLEAINSQGNIQVRSVRTEGRNQINDINTQGIAVIDRLNSVKADADATYDRLLDARRDANTSHDLLVDATGKARVAEINVVTATDVAKVEHDQLLADSADALENLHVAEQAALNRVEDKQSEAVQAVYDEGAREIRRVHTAGNERYAEVQEFLTTLGRDQTIRVNEAGDAQADRLEIIRETYTAQVEEQLQRAENFSDRLENTLAYSRGSAQQSTWELLRQVKAGEVIEIPVTYVVGRNGLLLNWAGMLLHQGLGFEEVGEEGEPSHQIKVNVDMLKGTYLSAWVSPSTSTGNIDYTEDRIQQAIQHMQELDANTEAQVAIFDSRIQAIDDHTQAGVASVDQHRDDGVTAVDTASTTAQDEIASKKQDALTAIQTAQDERLDAVNQVITDARTELDEKVEVATDAATRAEEAATRTLTLTKGAAQEVTWQLDQSCFAGDTLELPVHYVVGKNGLRLSWGGMELYRGVGFDEVGEDGEESNHVIIKTDILAGYYLNAWVSPNTYTGDIDETEARMEQAITRMSELNEGADAAVARIQAEGNTQVNRVVRKAQDAYSGIETRGTSALQALDARKDALASELENLGADAISRATAQADRSESEADRAKAAANLAIDRSSIYKGQNEQAAWYLEEAVSAGGELTLPVPYVVGWNNLLLSWGGMQLYPGLGYEEIGEAGTISRKVRMLRDLPENAQLLAWCLYANVEAEYEEHLTAIIAAKVRAEAAASEAEAKAAELNSVLEEAKATLISITTNTISTVPDDDNISNNGFYVVDPDLEGDSGSSAGDGAGSTPPTGTGE